MPFLGIGAQATMKKGSNKLSLGDMVKMAASQKKQTTFADIVKSATAQAASHFITEFHGVDTLQNVERMTIELADWMAVQKAISRYALRNQCDFNPVPFLVRDMDKGNTPIFKVSFENKS